MSDDNMMEVRVPDAQNPIELGLELLLGGIRLLAEEATMCDMWHAVADAYFLGDDNAEALYRQVLRFMEENDYVEKEQ
jgi:hypothetical protein